LVFVPTLWPDVTPAVLAGALREYAARKRRFGGLGERATEGEGG
jgi:undecaprenyl pyrophosphate synthase